MQNVEDIYGLTPTQAGMLFQCLHERDSELYFEQVRVDVGGTVQASDIQAAFEAVTRRHAALRTAIVWDGLDEPLQVVRGEVDVPFEILTRPDLTDQQLFELAADRRRVAFDLTSAPLQRVAVIERGDAGLHLIWEFHHILCDGWSAALVLDEVLRICNGEVLPELATSFRNYLGWHRAQDVEATAAYWKQLLDGVAGPTPLALPRASSDTDFLAGQHTETIGGAELEAIQEFARHQRVTLNTVVQAAWAVVQSMYSGSDDVIFGVTTSGRPGDLDDVQAIVGMFLNTLPMRTVVAPESSVNHWLASIQQQQLASSEHATASLAELHRQVGLNVGDDLFDTVLIFENFPNPTTDPDEQPSMWFGDKTVFEQTNYPLTLMVGIDGDLKLVANFDRNRFADQSVVRLMTQFATVVRNIPKAATIADLSVLTDADRDTIASWQGDEIPLDGSDTVVGRLLRQAQQTPDAVALIHGTDEITFAELVDRSRGVAARLARLGVEAEVPVGIALPRSIDMVVAMVGTLIAGGAYVPLDPRFPSARLRLMLQASGAPVVVSDSEFRSAVPAEDDVEVVDISTIPHLCDGAATLGETRPNSTMLLTFTSGSTGIPKGVKVHHAGVLNRLAWQWDRYPITAGEVVPHKTTLGFVDHLWEIWGGLLHGSSVVLIDDDVVTDPDALVEVLRRHRVRRISMVPSLLDLLMDHDPKLGENLPDLTMWSVSGEALSVATSRTFGSVLPEATLINLYGMSEASQDATFVEIDPSADVVPIGRPIANMKVHLLDHHDRQVPLGVPGQICVSGIGVSTGYWQRNDLTDERFVVNPHAGESDGIHGRMYRSGDIARWRNDGQLEYLGRTDHQVKVRGVRIELGEVETALASHPTVARTVVVGRDGPTGTELLAYVIAAEDAPIVLDELRIHAQDHLPEVMVPQRFVELRDFPLLPNGKVNRDALPAPAARANGAPKEDSSPLSAEQLQMLGVWRSVMAQPHLGADTDFFDAGGHSMLAMRLVSRIKRELGLSVGLAQLLKTGTARSLADAMGQAPRQSEQTSPQQDHLVPIRPARPELRTMFVVHGAGGDVLNFRALGHHLDGVVNVVGIQAAGVDGVADLHRSRTDMVEAYLEQIRSHQSEGPYLIAGFSIGGLIAFELASQLKHEAEMLVLFDTFHPSLTPRSIPRSEHLGKLARDPRYGLDRLKGKVTARRERKERDQWLSPSASGPVPFEVRKWEITSNSISLWRDYQPPVVDLPLVVVSAEENSDVWDGIPADRGWSAHADNVEVVRVPGDHMTLVEEPNTATLVARLTASWRRSGVITDG